MLDFKKLFSLIIYYPYAHTRQNMETRMTNGSRVYFDDSLPEFNIIPKRFKIYRKLTSFKKVASLLFLHLFLRFHRLRRAFAKKQQAK